MSQNAETVTARGWSTPPNSLVRLFIDVANTEDLPDLHDALYSLVDSPSPIDIRTRWRDSCADIAVNLSPSVQQFLGSPKNEFRSFLDNYDLLRRGQEVVKTLARRYRDKGPAESPLTVFDPKFSADFPISIEVNLVPDEKGRLALTEPDQILSAFVGIPADRIRSCEICKRYFWALRLNSECCSQRCRKRFNQRNSRAARGRSRRKRDTEKNPNHHPAK
jgi:hypothetical protein